MSWIGSVIGSVVGFIALMCGALFNAHLTRKRDDRMRNDEAASVRTAIGTELAGFDPAIMMRFHYLLLYADDPELMKKQPATAAAARLNLPPMTVRNALAPKLSLLDKNDAHDVTLLWQEIEQQRAILASSVQEMIAGVLTAETAKKRIGYAGQTAERCRELANRLTGLDLKSPFDLTT